MLSQDFLRELDETFPELGIYKQGRIQTSPGVEEQWKTHASDRGVLFPPAMAGNFWEPNGVLSSLRCTLAGSHKPWASYQAG